MYVFLYQHNVHGTIFIKQYDILNVGQILRLLLSSVDRFDI
jgi:hypothetical protein